VNEAIRPPVSMSNNKMRLEVMVSSYSSRRAAGVGAVTSLVPSALAAEATVDIVAMGPTCCGFMG
jgi:hypothetical protein